MALAALLIAPARRAAVAVTRAARLDPPTTPSRLPLSAWLRLYCVFAALHRKFRNASSGRTRGYVGSSDGFRKCTGPECHETRSRSRSAW